MKYLTEFRNGEIAQRMAREIAAVTTRPWKIMEVCGGQTHSIIKNGIDQMLPAGIEMIHGPGCPVCVTPLELIDKALAIAAVPGVIFCSFGDMLRVPGTDADLFQIKGAGGDVRVDAFENAAMILSGMGPVATLQTDAGKIFAGCYALFSGIALITILGIIFAPVVHRFLHKFHLEDETRNKKSE